MPSINRAISNDLGPSVTVDAVLDEIRAALERHPELYPGEVGQRHFRKLLDGEKPLGLKMFFEVLDRIVRKYGETGREMVRRVFDVALSTYLMHAADGESIRPVKSIDAEQMEFHLAGARLTVMVDEAENGDDRARREIPKLAARVRAELSDIETAIARER